MIRGLSSRAEIYLAFLTNPSGAIKNGDTIIETLSVLFACSIAMDERKLFRLQPFGGKKTRTFLPVVNAIILRHIRFLCISKANTKQMDINAINGRIIRKTALIVIIATPVPKKVKA